MSSTFLLTEINAALAYGVALGRTISLDNLLWPINGALQAPLGSSVVGPSARTISGNQSLATALTIFPQGSPNPVWGGGFVQQAANTDVVQFTGAGDAPDWHNVILTFQTPWLNTGNGITSKAAVDSHGVTPDYGGINCVLDNIIVYGHDGSHYGFELWNWELATFSRLRSYGGGGVHFVNYSSTLQNGNIAWIDCYCATFLGGTAHCYFFDNQNAAPVDFCTYSRVQGWLANITAFNSTPQPPGTTAPTNAQFLRKVSGSWVSQKITDSGDDMEGNISGTVTNVFVGPGNDCPSTGQLGGVSTSGAVSTNTLGTIQQVSETFTLSPLSSNPLTLFFGETGTGKIGRATAAGASQNNTWESASQVLGVAIDANYLYFAQGAGNIGRVGLDGSNINFDFITTGSTSITGIAVNGSNIFWADKTGGKIGQATLAGGSINGSFITGCTTPGGIALDASFIYWTEQGGNTIGRATLAGATPNHSFITGCSTPCGIAVNASNIFWTNFGTGDIGQATLAGGSVTQTFITGGSGCYGISIDTASIFWTNFSSGKIGTATLAGGTVNQSFLTVGGSPAGLAEGVVSGAATVCGFVNGFLADMWIEPAAGTVGRVVTSQLLVPSSGTFSWTFQNAAPGASVYANSLTAFTLPVRPAIGW